MVALKTVDTVRPSWCIKGSMKGIVFTEFLEMVERLFSAAMADHIIGATPSRTQGAYTAVGNYDHTELAGMVAALSQATQVPIPDLMRSFGRHLAGRFAATFGGFFANHDNTLDFLASVDAVIHVEVLKLYPDAQLPSLKVLQRSEQHLALHYVSSRHLHDLALGLIEGAAAHYGGQILIAQQVLPDGSMRFDIRQAAHAAAD